MRGILYKNAIITVRQLKNNLIVFAVFLIMSVMPGLGSYWAIYDAVMISMFAGILYRMDESMKWNKYCDILPLSRKTIVTSYYVSNYALLIFAVLIYVIASTVFRLVYGNENVTWIIAAIMTIVSLLMISVTTPLTLKFGAHGSVVVQMIITAMIAGAGIAILKNGNSVIYSFSEISSSVIILGIILAIIILTIASWIISVRIYEKREM